MIERTEAARAPAAPTRTWDVAIVGAGYVGVPLAHTLATAGRSVLLVDVVPDVVDALNRGQSHIEDVADDELRALVSDGRLSATTDYDSLRDADAILIALPTPLSKQREPDLRILLSATQEIAKRLQPGHLVVLESTTYPGTTREQLLPILESTGLRAGEDFCLAFSPERVDPGPGLGGHCIPIDPFYLTWKAREYGFTTEFIELAGKVNESMPYYCRSVISQALNHRKQLSMSGSKILILGVAYKPDIGDVRESPAVKLIELLRNAGADVSYHDPHVSSVHKLGLESVPLEPEAYDCVAIVTDHSSIDYDELVRRSSLIVDFRNATGANGRHSDKVERL